MTKKNTKKTDTVTEIPTNAVLEAKEGVNENNTNVNDVVCCCEPSLFDNRPHIIYLSPQELESIERMLRMLVLYYEQMLRIDEVEGRPVMSTNRNKYTRLSALHKRLMEHIENKVLKLEDYVWED